ncbi:MAG: MBL fold metallo-hydrolase [Desulfobacteraceae bacterium]|nr:MBL fold metallo-hydrolase [Desulfobacteraceae bacterium]
MEKDRIIIHRENVGTYAVNTYIIACHQTMKGAIIDPGGENEKIFNIIQREKIIPQYVLNTHGHRDHVFSNSAMAKRYGIPVLMHHQDRIFFQNRTQNSEPDIQKAYEIHQDLFDNDILALGKLKIKVIHTKGHTRGSVCFLVEDCLFSGDTIFVGNAGRTDLPGGNLTDLIQSIKQKIITLPPETIIFPGHDYGPTPYSTVAREIKENIYITDFITGDI